MQPVRYRGIVYDSARWEGFQLRPGDVVISTPPKCGTTWMQMICALLVFQQPELPAPLATISPWIDMVTRPRKELFARLAAQEHRRIIKTHTPLDGLPQDPAVTYVAVGRDPRDVAVSMDHHLANLDLEEFARARAEAARIDGIEPPPLAPPPARPEAAIDRFWAFVDDDTDPTSSSPRLRFLARHLQTFWDAPRHLDVVLVHYDELQDDLPGRMRSLADHLGITVPDVLWPELVRAASLEEMRARAERMVPGASPAQWRDPAQFFHKGTSGQWRELLDAPGVARYLTRIRSLVSPELAAWLHRR